MYLPLLLCLYESFWKGFESDQIETVNIAGYQMRLLVWRVVNKGRTIRKVLGVGRGGEFSSRRNFFALPNSLYEFFLGHSRNIF